MKKIPIVYQDSEIIVCEKPIGMPVQSDRSRDRDLISQLKYDLYLAQDQEGEPYLVPVHRLDRPVGGLLVLARTREAAAELSRQIREDLFEKNYQAIVCGSLPEEAGSLEDWLLRDPRTNRSRVVPETTPGAKYALLDYELIDMVEYKGKLLSWMLVSLHTGRHHQIRVQFASRGCGLFGDSKYNPAGYEKGMTPGLYATRLSFLHPGTGERLTFKTEPRGKAFEIMDVEAF